MRQKSTYIQAENKDNLIRGLPVVYIGTTSNPNRPSQPQSDTANAIERLDLKYSLPLFFSFQMAETPTLASIKRYRSFSLRSLSTTATQMRRIMSTAKEQRLSAFCFAVH